MNYKDFIGRIRSNLPHVFLLAGEERYYIDKSLEALLRVLFPDDDRNNGLTKMANPVDIDELVNLIESVPFFAARNVIVADGTSLFSASKRKDNAESEEEKKKPSGKDKRLDALTEALSDMPNFSYVIFTMDEKPDKRKKLAKTVEKAGLVLDADPVKPWRIEQDWLRPKLRSIGRELADDAYAYFSYAVSMMKTIPLSFLNNEFDKIAALSSSNVITKDEIVESFADIPEVSLYAITDAIDAKDAKKAFTLLHRNLADGVYFTVVVSILARHVRQLMTARCLAADGVQGEALAKPLGLHPFIAKKLAEAASSFNDEQLEQALIELADADYAMKTGAGGNELLEHVLVVLCK